MSIVKLKPGWLQRQAEQVVNCHPAHVRKLQAALSAAIPFVFEHGHHIHPHCYRGSDDGCYCGVLTRGSRDHWSKENHNVLAQQLRRVKS
jgi:hypothetical protein